MTSRKEGKSDAKEAKHSKAQFLLSTQGGVRNRIDYDPKKIFLEVVPRTPSDERSYHPLTYHVAKDSEIPLCFRTPFLLSGFGAGRAEFKNGTKGGSRIPFNIEGKPLGPDNTPNPINEFHEFAKKFDEDIKHIARAYKLLGEVPDSAYDQFYVPLVKCPNPKYTDQMTIKLSTRYGRDLWKLWQLHISDPKKNKLINKGEKGYDTWNTLLSTDFTASSIWVTHGTATSKPSYGVSVETDVLYRPPEEYLEGFNVPDDKDKECPW